MARKRARIQRGDGTSEWTLHSDQQLVGICCDGDAASLVASGERHAQLRPLRAGTSGGSVVGVGRLLPLESSQTSLRRAQSGDARYYVVTSSLSDTIRLLDAVRMEFEDVPFADKVRPSGRVDAAFVDESGTSIVLVEHSGGSDEEAASWRLWCWRRYNERSVKPASGMWTERSVPVAHALRRWATFDAQFFSSAMFGPCVLIVGMTRDLSKGGRYILLKMLLSADGDDWTLLRSSCQPVELPSAAGTTIDYEPVMKLFISPSRRWLVVQEGSQHLRFVSLELYDSRELLQVPAHHSRSYPAPVIDVACLENVTLVLLEDGSLHPIELPLDPNAPLIPVEATLHATIVTHFSLNELLKEPPISVRWHRLVWIPSRNWLVAGYGSMVIRILMHIEEIGGTAAILSVATIEEVKTSETLESVCSLRRRKRRLAPAQRKETVEELVGDILHSSSSSKLAVSDLFTAMRLILSSQDASVADVTLTLIRISLQRILRRLGFSRGDQQHTLGAEGDTPIHIGITEMLIAQVVSLGHVHVHTIARRVVQAPAFRSRGERRSYYHQAVHWLTHSYQFAGDSAQHSQFVSSITNCLHQTAAAALTWSTKTIEEQIRKRLDRVKILQQLNASDSIQAGKRLVGELERRAAPPTRLCPWLRLEAACLCYMMACDILQVNRAILDMSSLSEALRQDKTGTFSKVLGSRFITRFVSLSSSDPARPRSHDTEELDVLHRLAALSGWTDAVITWYVHLCKSNPYHCLSRHQTNSSEDSDKAVSTEILNCSLVELISILRSATLPVPAAGTSQPSWTTFVEADATSLELFVKLVFVITAPGSCPDQTILFGGEAPATRLGAHEVVLRRDVLVLARAVMHHMRVLITPLAGEAAGDALTRVFRETCLVDQLWAETRNAVFDHVVSDVFEPTDADKKGPVCGRITGLCLGEKAEKSPRDAASAPLNRALRSFALLLWSYWIRERASRCKKAIAEYKQRNLTSDPEEYKTDSLKFGRFAALCALQLKTLALFRDPSDEDEIVSIQLYLLDAASKLNPAATFHVLEWGFPLDSMSARYHRRFRTIHEAAEMHTEAASTTQRIDRCRQELRRAVAMSPQGSLRRELFEEMDAFGNCCCDSDFQRLVWALQQRRFVVEEVDTVQTNRFKLKKAVMTRPSSVDGLISRHEVTNLLQAQRAEIEQQMQRLCRISEEQIDSASITRPMKEQAIQPDMSQLVLDGETRLPVQIDARPPVRLEVRDLKPHRRSHHRHQKAQAPPPPKNATLRKGASTQNVLRLLQLRKDSQDLRRYQSAPRMVAVPAKSSPEPAAPPTASESTLAPAPAPAAAKTKTKTKTARPCERVLPLRRDHAETAELILLSTATKRSVPLTRRSFRLAMPSSRSPSDEAPDFASSGAQWTEIRSTSVQTETAVDDVEPKSCDSSSPSQAEQPSPLDASIAVLQPKAQAEIGVQYQPPPVPSARRHGSADAMAMIHSRFPVFVDLNQAASTTSGTFVHVARVFERDSGRRDSDSGARERERIARVPFVNLDDSTEQKKTETPATAVVESSSKEEEEGTAQKEQHLLEHRRQTYLCHYPPTIPRLMRSNSTSNVSSFTTLKSEMERMKAKLLELEHCAQDLDDDFRATHHNLGDMGETRRPILDEIDTVIEATRSGNDGAVRGTLGTKAARDMDDARHLLAEIERLSTTTE